MCVTKRWLLRHLHPLSLQVCLKEMGKWSHARYTLEYEIEWGRKLPALYDYLLFYSQELKIHLDCFTFGTVLLQKIKASELHLLGPASHPPSLKITNPNVTCQCWFSQKANRMLHSQCPYTSAASKQPTPPNGCWPDFGSLPALKGREGRRCPAATLLSFRKWRGCLAANLSVQISSLCRLYQMNPNVKTFYIWIAVQGRLHSFQSK